ncbi:MAG: peptidylprolyl isomerase [Flavobacteriales bacterium]
MAVIGSIRKRGGLIVFFVGGALVLFILSALFENSQGYGRADQTIGDVGGSEMSLKEFSMRVENEANSLRNDFGQQVDNAQMEQLRNRLWNEMVKERLMMPQIEAAGFGSTLTKSEYDDIRFGDNVLPDFKNQPNFQKPDGSVNPEALKNYFKNVFEQAPVYHEIQKDRLVHERLYTKYNTLVKKSVFVNSAQARDEFAAANRKATFNFIAKRYDSEADSLYIPNEEEIKRYYNEHKDERKNRQLASRSFEYVLFEVKPSDEDIKAMEKDMNELKSDLEKSTNDSAFVMANADTKNAAPVAYTAGTADAITDSLILKADTGAVVGPYRDGENWKLVKVVELAKVEEARVRHILLSTQGKSPEETEKIKQRADSILAVVKKNKGKFEEMVTKYTEDPGSKSTGGVYEWFDRKRMVPEFTTASFDEKVGATTIAKTTYGFHIVEVLGQRDRDERRILTVDRKARPSGDTFKKRFKEANTFRGNLADSAAFHKAAKDLGVEVRNVAELRPDMRYVPGLQEPYQLITWANNAEVGNVSNVLTIGDNHVVAILTGIKKEGAPELEDVREKFTVEATKQKKAAAWMKNMEGKTDLSALGTELGLSATTATDLLLNASAIPGGYSENELIGTIFSLQDGSTSKPLKGDQGVYVVQMTTNLPAPEATDVSAEKASIKQRTEGRVEGTMFNALKEAAGVKDERGKFF